MRFPSNGCREGFCWACWHGAPTADWCLRPMPNQAEVGLLQRYEWMGLKRPEPLSGNGGVPASAAEGMLPKSYPTLFAMLSDSSYEDGSARQTATLLMFVEGGTVKLCLNDRDNGRTAWAAATSLENAMKSLEGRLVKDQVEWRPSGQGKPSGRKGGGR